MNKGQVDSFVQALYKRQSAIEIKQCNKGSHNDIISGAIKHDIRLLAMIELDKISINYSRQSRLSFKEDYIFNIEYSKEIRNIEQVQIYEKKEDLALCLQDVNFNVKHIVTRNYSLLEDEINNVIENLILDLEGFTGLKWQHLEFEGISLVKLYSDTVMENRELERKIRQARFAAKTVVTKITRNSFVPDILKVYLAFTYLTQNCKLDKRASEEELENGNFDYPLSKLAYGPLVNNSGDSFGIAWAFRYILEELNVECKCVLGMTESEDLVENEHMWNLVKIESQYYHIDVSLNIDVEGVFIGSFMKDEIFMNQYYGWNTALYPKAKGRAYNYDFIEQYLLENGDSLLRQGIEEMYLFPEPIYDF